VNRNVSWIVSGLPGGAGIYFIHNAHTLSVWTNLEIRLAKRTGKRTLCLMKTMTATSARSDLYKVIDTALSDHEPVQITGKRGNAILVSEADWRAIQETLYLVSISGMRESIVKGMAESPDACSREIDL
jgi:PHD/YefM family antitoxin component YafN of YafNO toxin-antitoxin module